MGVFFLILNQVALNEAGEKKKKKSSLPDLLIFPKDDC